MFIYPSMLSEDPTKLGKELISAEKAGADAIHWDIMDGAFVGPIAFGHHIVAAHRKLSHLRFDVHLMVRNPDKHLKNFAAAGADVIIAHVETCRRLHRTLDKIKSLGKKTGVALNPATSIDDIAYCVDLLDMVIVMAVNPGKAGQVFIESQMKKILELKKNLPPSVEICVDGGITDLTIVDCLRCGANSFVSGSYIFKSVSYSKAIKKLRKISIS
jgi:ribulose-phosphate 3-epimerase